MEGWRCSTEAEPQVVVGYVGGHGCAMARIVRSCYEGLEGEHVATRVCSFHE